MNEVLKIDYFFFERKKREWNDQWCAWKIDFFRFSVKEEWYLMLTTNILIEIFLGDLERDFLFEYTVTW